MLGLPMTLMKDFTGITPDMKKQPNFFKMRPKAIDPFPHQLSIN